MRSPRHKLTRGQRGWYKSIDGRTRWIVSLKAAPSGEDADAVFENRFKELCQSPARGHSDVTVIDLFNRYIGSRQPEVQAGNLSPRTTGDYTDAGARFVEATGNLLARSIRRHHFSAFAKFIQPLSPSRRAKLVITTRTVFRWGDRAGLIDEPDFGPDLRVPRRLEFRLRKRERGPRLYDAGQVKKLIVGANDEMFAMILMALNGGMGNKDVATAEDSMIDAATQWFRDIRGKTGVDREFPLWPEAFAVVKGRKGLLFRQPNGYPWIDSSGRSHKDHLAKEFAPLCQRVGVPNYGFYSLRRTFRTIADGLGDQRAVALIMGHETGDIGSIYVQAISPDRLKRICDAVRAELRISEGVRQRNRLKKKGSRAATAAGSHSSRTSKHQR